MSIRATFSYFQGMEGDMYQFYRIPKLLFTSEYFKNLSCEAKGTVWSYVRSDVAFDKKSLAGRGRQSIYFFSVEEIMEMLNCGRNKAVNCLKELDQETGIGLIEKKRLGLGKANVIYVKNFSLREYPDEPAEMKIETDDPEYEEQIPCNFEENMPENAVNTQKFEKQTLRSLENKLQEVSKTNFKKFEKQTSGSLKNKLQEVSKANCNNTEYNDNESSKTESYPSIHHDRKDVDKMDERYAYRQIICDNIEYDILCQSYKPESVEELVELMLDAICTKKKYLQINGEAMPAQVVKNRLLKVGYEHIQYVFFSLSKNTTKVKNIRQYMLTVLYNAPVTINQFYDAEVRHDMYGG